MLLTSTFGANFLFEPVRADRGALVVSDDDPGRGRAEMAPEFGALTSWNELCEVVLFWVSFLLGWTGRLCELNPVRT